MRCPVRVVCCLVIVIGCVLFVAWMYLVCWSLFALLEKNLFFSFLCLLLLVCLCVVVDASVFVVVVCYMLCLICCLLLVVCRLVFGVRRLALGVRRFGVWCLAFGVFEFAACLLLFVDRCVLLAICFLFYELGCVVCCLLFNVCSSLFVVCCVLLVPLLVVWCVLCIVRCCVLFVWRRPLAMAYVFVIRGWCFDDCCVVVCCCFVACCVLFVVSFSFLFFLFSPLFFSLSSRVVCHLLFVVRGSLFVCGLLSDSYWLLVVVYCRRFDVRCPLSLFNVCCLSCVVCCLLVVG